MYSHSNKTFSIAGLFLLFFVSITCELSATEWAKETAKTGISISKASCAKLKTSCTR